jgi:methyl-accepting chemotaxis protein
MLIENKTNGLTLDASSDILLKNVDTLNQNSNEATAGEAANEIKALVQNATSKANSGKKIADEMISGYTALNENISKTRYTKSCITI